MGDDVRLAYRRLVQCGCQGFRVLLQGVAEVDGAVTQAMARQAHEQRSASREFGPRGDMGVIAADAAPSPWTYTRPGPSPHPVTS
ncbi:hypothetical protein GCM10010252_61230 [Streptomyces aureoverticillatus]|nr:hypothetical protein GCM10010252_61230 [Streptomyces aureoverticillatus]